ncbi:MAG: hypothetical protein KatS3mg105_3261 [Gemmatales bacterium]|nr:MAG: hypothetical protein KatS3mg105_3261 [Gemmatales bacterium]
MTPDRNDAKPTNIRWLVFILACGTSWLLYLHRYTWNIIEPHLKQEFHLSNTESGTIFSIFFVGYTAAQIPSGIIGDMFGVHFFLGIIIILWSLFMGGFGLGWNAFSLGSHAFGIRHSSGRGLPCFGPGD